MSVNFKPEYTITNTSLILIELDTKGTITFDSSELGELLEETLYGVYSILEMHQVAYEVHDQPNHGLITINVLP